MVQRICFWIVLDLESLEGLPPLMQEEEDDTGDTDLFMTKFQEAFAMEKTKEETVFETDDGHRPIFLIIFSARCERSICVGQAWAVIDADTGRLLDGIQ